jgi:hypothetical protein
MPLLDKFASLVVPRASQLIACSPMKALPRQLGSGPVSGPLRAGIRPITRSIVSPAACRAAVGRAHDAAPAPAAFLGQPLAGPHAAARPALGQSR